MNYREMNHWKIEQVSVGLIFFAQVFDELLFDYTIDSYKPNALNSPSLCTEAIELINDIEAERIDKNNLKPVICELKCILKKDFVAKKLLNSSIDYYTNHVEDQPISELQKRLSLLERSINNNRYIQELKNQLFDSVIHNEKDKILYLSKNLITSYMNWGISKRFLYQEFNKFFYDSTNEIDSNDLLNVFFEQIMPKNHSFNVYFKISKNIVKLKDSFKFFNIVEIGEEDKVYKDQIKQIFTKKIYNAKTIKIVRIKAADPFSARNIAESRLETLKNISQVYFHTNYIKWGMNCLIIKNCCDKSQTVARENMNPMIAAYNHSANDLSKLTNSFFKNISLVGDSFYKFVRAIELHSNSVHNLKTENQIVNLWTILESIVPANSKKSKVANIIELIIPILQKNYYKKILQTLLNDIKRWNEIKILEYLDNVEGECSYEQKLSLFITQESQDYLSLKQELGDYHLLRNRIYKISKIISNKEKLLNDLDRHKEVVCWQLRRIYRTRNMIVHSGAKKSYINVLIENAHDYIDQVIFEIIKLTTSDYHVKTLEQSFGISSLLYKEMYDKIKESNAIEDYLDYF